MAFGDWVSAPSLPPMLFNHHHTCSLLKFLPGRYLYMTDSHSNDSNTVFDVYGYKEVHVAIQMSCATEISYNCGSDQYVFVLFSNSKRWILSSICKKNYRYWRTLFRDWEIICISYNIMWFHCMLLWNYEKYDLVLLKALWLT